VEIVTIVLAFNYSTPIHTTQTKHTLNPTLLPMAISAHNYEKV
jgi:hypothetical protein